MAFAPLRNYAPSLSITVINWRATALLSVGGLAPRTLAPTAKWEQILQQLPILSHYVLDF
jgi:hypothetical protein